MSVTIKELIENAGYDLDTREDMEWLLGQVHQFEEMVDAAEERIMELDETEEE